MVTATVLKAEIRTGKGTSAARRLRRGGQVPAVMGARSGESVLLAVNRHDFDMLLRRHTGDNVIVDLQIGGEEPRKVLLTEVQRNGLSGASEHADFHEVSMTEKMRVHVPVELYGEPAGIQEGGILEQLIREVEVECLPGDMVDSIRIDVSALKTGEALPLGKVAIDPKLTLITSPDVAVAAVIIPRAAEEEEAAAEATAETAAEPEVISKGKKEEEEGEAAPAPAEKKQKSKE